MLYVSLRAERSNLRALGIASSFHSSQRQNHAPRKRMDTFANITRHSGIQPIVNFARSKRRRFIVNLMVNLYENTALLIIVAKDIYDYV